MYVSSHTRSTHQIRTHKIAMTVDIDKMFCDVGLQEADHDLHRFVWRPEEKGLPLDCQNEMFDFWSSFFTLPGNSSP